MSEKTGSLALLCEKLRQGTPRQLKPMVYLLTGAEDYRQFRILIKEFLFPDKERRILAEKTPADQMAKFATYFEERYLPLEYFFKDGGAEEYAQLVNEVPIIAMGYSYDSYTELYQDGHNTRDGLLLMTLLAEDPINDQGERVLLAQACG